MHEGAAINPRRDFAERNNYGTPLYVAVENGHFPIVMYLIEQGAHYKFALVVVQVRRLSLVFLKHSNALKMLIL